LEKMEAGKMQMAPELTSLNASVERSLDSLSTLCQNNEVQIKVGNIDFTVFADADRLEQVLVNLLSNAVKFSPANSEVIVEAESFDDFIEVRVKDSGRGVPSQHKVAIFERYQQVAIADAAKKGGTGLGLPVCKLIVEQLGGSIGVDSVENGGSTFWFRLLKKEPT
jgi:signal transduction histidine kinase